MCLCNGGEAALNGCVSPSSFASPSTTEGAVTHSACATVPKALLAMGSTEVVVGGGGEAREAFSLRWDEADAVCRWYTGGGGGGEGGVGGVSGLSNVRVMRRRKARFNGAESEGKTAPIDSVTTTCIKEKGVVLKAI